MSPRLILPEPNSRWALFLDVDGTLIEYFGSPEEVVVPTGLRTLLESLYTAFGGAVALVSGRSIASVDALFAPLRMPVAGQHGFERRTVDGAIQQSVSPPDDIVGLVRNAALSLARVNTGIHVEDKGVSFAVHYRHAPEYGEIVANAVKDIARNSEGFYEVQQGLFVYELKPRGPTKGAAIRAFCREAPFANRIPVVAGDDLTDETAFAAANALDGISIRVGCAPRPTLAEYEIADPHNLREWLRAVDQHQRMETGGSRA